MEYPHKVTKEYLSSLPKIQIKPTGDVSCFVRYDENLNLIYMLDGEGNFTGKVAPADNMERLESPEEPKQKEPEPVQEALPSEEAEEDVEEPETNGKGKKKWLAPVLIALAAIAVILVAIVLGKASNIVKDRTEVLEPTQNSEQAAVPETTEPIALDQSEEEEEAQQEEMVVVLAADKTLLPGQPLTAEDIQLEEIRESEYRLIAGANGLYTEENAENLYGQMVVTYLPSGSYLTYSDLAASYNPINPWSRTEEQQGLVPLAVTVTSDTWAQHLWGTEATVKIEAQTKITTENTDGEEDTENTLPAGINYSNSIVESMVLDTYEIQKAVIVDVLDSAGNSLFARYSALAEIPSGFLSGVLEEEYATAEDMQTMIPATIMLALPQDEAAVISALSADTITVSILQAVPGITTDLQSEVYGKLQNVSYALSARMEALNTIEQGD